VSHPHVRHLAESVMNVLHDLDVHETPIVTVLNKMDAVTDPSWIEDVQRLFPGGITMSALTGKNKEVLLDRLMLLSGEGSVEIDVTLPLSRMDLVHMAHKEGEVQSISYDAETVHLRARLPRSLARFFPGVPPVNEETEE